MGEEKKGFPVDGFLFRDKEFADKAKKEREGIKYIREKASMDNPKIVLEVYNKIIQQELFETPIGIGYLRELQEYLMTNPQINKEEISPIPVEDIICQEFISLKEAEQRPVVSSGKMKLSLTLNIALAVMVLAMFVITLTSKHPNILNYEEKILNKYAAWEEDLDRRQQEILEREKALEMAE